MNDKNIGQYIGLITSQHRDKEKFTDTVKAVIQPIVDCFNFLSHLQEKYDVETANDPYLETLARWTGTPLVIAGAAELPFFGFIDQDSALTFGEQGFPDIGGYFRESGQSGTAGLPLKGDLLRKLIKAKILKNKSTGNINETKEIIKLVLGHELFKVTDNKDMTITFHFLTEYTMQQVMLVASFIPRPAGVQLLFAS